jgi:hypothetical protein
MPMGFQERYQTVTGALYGPLAAEAGLPEDQIETAERALGFRLPLALRDFHVFLGNFLR